MSQARFKKRSGADRGVCLLDGGDGREVKTLNHDSINHFVFTRSPNHFSRQRGSFAGLAFHLDIQDAIVSAEEFVDLGQTREALAGVWRWNVRPFSKPTSDVDRSQLLRR